MADGGAVLRRAGGAHREEEGGALREALLVEKAAGRPEDVSAHGVACGAAGGTAAPVTITEGRRCNSQNLVAVNWASRGVIGVSGRTGGRGDAGKSDVQARLGEEAAREAVVRERNGMQESGQRQGP